jgi:hypothetical protein
MESNSNNYSSTFTIHALVGYSNSLTMWVDGFIKHQPMMVLLILVILTISWILVLQRIFASTETL